MESPLIEAHPKLGYVAGTVPVIPTSAVPAVIWKAPRLSWVALLSVIAAHVVVLALLASLGAFSAPVVMPSTLMVEMITPQSEITPPKPDIVPPKPKPVARQERPTPVAPTPVLAAQTLQPAPVQDSMPLAPPSPPAPPAPVVQSVPPRFDAAYLDNPEPAYPSLARRAGEEGRVILRVMVEANGLPSAVNVQTSSGFERLDDAALAAVRYWKFVPARRGTEAVSAAVLVPVDFKLRKIKE